MSQAEENNGNLFNELLESIGEQSRDEDTLPLLNSRNYYFDLYRFEKVKNKINNCSASLVLFISSFKTYVYIFNPPWLRAMHCA